MTRMDSGTPGLELSTRPPEGIVVAAIGCETHVSSRRAALAQASSRRPCCLSRFWPRMTLVALRSVALGRRARRRSTPIP